MAREGRVVRERAEVPEGCKWCPGCEVVKPFGEWSANRSARDGLNSYCKACKALRNADHHLKKTYGLTRGELDGMLAAQGGLCRICRRSAAVHVDHDHKTGEVRGVLCFKCNVALGQLDDDPERMSRAVEYVSPQEDAAVRRSPHMEVVPGVYQRTLCVVGAEVVRRWTPVPLNMVAIR
ncbi:endonuclease VII domain-containing protein [Spirillospora sp. NBC_01491]|uniref:endonuclease VII domain-containing protein n=1 Tax=Spirillospora sp. NBC_01491 TaxID=2976007 RepID=UPI002E376D8D|nr:endonuclease VII domain-containing protein [Spirillospora sp. NBC_01491]